MKPANARPNSFRKPPFKRHNTKPIVNYQVKGFSSDSDNKNNEMHTANSFSTLYSGSEEEKERKDWHKVRIMFEGMLLKDSEPENPRNRKFQDAREKSGPNPKKISLPWFV